VASDIPAILQLIAAREAATNLAAGRLREQIAALTTELTQLDAELTELAITRTTVLRLAGDPDTTRPVDAIIASPAYQQIIAAFAASTDPMRAKDVCLALGTGITAKDTEGLRAKLKRLVARQILAETEPGLFTLAQQPPSAEPVSRDPDSTPNP
jgi:hypothetical protein